MDLYRSPYRVHALNNTGGLDALMPNARSDKGIPHLIDNLMTDALTLGSQPDKKVIDAEIIRAAVDNQGLYWWSFLSTDLRLWLLSWSYFKSSAATFQTRLRQSVVNPLRVCGKYRYGTIGETFPQKSKCGLRLPQCAVWQLCSLRHFSLIHFRRLMANQLFFPTASLCTRSFLSLMHRGNQHSGQMVSSSLITKNIFFLIAF